MKTDETESQEVVPQKWEYIVRTITDGIGMSNSLQACLNAHGPSGFEAFSILASDQDRLHTIIFKRPCN